MKRIFDAISGAVLLLALAPIFLVIAMLVALLLGRPILFSQSRPGRHGKPFRMVKFRSMSDQRDCYGELLPDQERLGRFGRFLRSTSLDELPELWNVVKGEMSLVGPRPLLMQYLPLYSAHEARRHEVRPGITGWTQIKGRNSLSWSEKFDLDVWYVDHRNMWLDIRILFLTLAKVVRREGISGTGHATMPVFDGTRPDR